MLKTKWLPELFKYYSFLGKVVYDQLLVGYDHATGTDLQSCTLYPYLSYAAPRNILVP